MCGVRVGVRVFVCDLCVCLLVSLRLRPHVIAFVCVCLFICLFCGVACFSFVVPMYHVCLCLCLGVSAVCCACWLLVLNRAALAKYSFVCVCVVGWC